MGTLSYLKNFLRDPDVASVTPSSPFLVRRVCQWMDFQRPETVVEYGPGTGVFSAHIAERMHPGSHLVLIESNADFCATLRERFAGDGRVTVVNDRAERVSVILDRADIDEADVVLSGIPFSFLDDDVRHDLLMRTRDVLADDGVFLVYQAYNHLERPLRHHFGDVEKEFELLNLPPMFAYRARALTSTGGDGAPA
jgi:phospholipid N-methyltransferase